MSAIEQFKAVQAALGLTGKDVDGIPGDFTAAAYQVLAKRALAEYRESQGKGDGIILSGAPGWKFNALIEGEDIILRNVTATWFGGDSDPLDNGETASGVMTKGNPGVMGCALQVISGHPSTKGSPIAFPRPFPAPGIPWLTKVEVSRIGHDAVEVELIDNGPAKSAGDAIDLTVAAFRALGGSLRQGVLTGVDARIIGAAKYARA